MLDNGNSKELHARVFELTLALYRVTDFFPQGEVLRKNIREKANEIFGNIFEYEAALEERDIYGIRAKIHAIQGYLELARSMRFVNPINISVLNREYGALLRQLEQKITKAGRQNEPAHAEERPLPQDEKKEAPADIVAEKLPTWQEFSHDTQVSEDLTHISEDLNDRQKKIIEHLSTNGQARISDFFSVFNEISSKTIQRDLQDLVSKHVLKREGDRRWTTYSLNGVR